MRSDVRGPLLCAGMALMLAAPAAASAAWGPPVLLGTAGGADHRAPAIARNAAGDAVAAWVRAPASAAPGSGRVLLSERRGASGRWTRARVVSGPGVGAPAADIGPRGAALVAWGVGSRVFVASRDARTSRWRTAAVATGPGRVTDLAAGADASGAMAVMWAESIGARYRVRRAARPVPGGRWRIGASAIVTAGRPALATGAGGNGVAAWVTDGRVAVARATAAGFERPELAGSGDSPIPALSMAGSGRLLAGWRTTLPGGTTVVGAAAGGPTGELRQLGDVGVGDGPRVGINARGDAAVAWSLADRDGDRAGVQALVARAGGSFVPSSVVRPAACQCTYAVAEVAIDGAGGPVVAWRRTSRRAADVAAVSSRAGAGGPWRAIALRPTPEVNGVALAVDGTPGAAVAWVYPSGARAMLRGRVR
jgi:hypothetical protein